MTFVRCPNPAYAKRMRDENYSANTWVNRTKSMECLTNKQEVQEYIQIPPQMLEAEFDVKWMENTGRKPGGIDRTSLHN